VSSSIWAGDAQSIVAPRPDRIRLGLVGVLLALYVALGMRGYGNDNDTYHMLNTWNMLHSQGVYQPSRNTGYLVPEMAIGLLSSMGGHVLSNVAISLLSAAVLWLLFGTVQRHVDRPTAILATLTLGLHPVWIIASSTSMDYLYALSSFAFGMWALDRRRPIAAAVFFGVSVSARITFAMAVAAVYGAAAIAYWGDRARCRGLLPSFVGAGLLTSLLFVPSFLAAGKTLQFLTFSESQPFNIARAGANDALKQLLFWGVPALVLIALYLAFHGPRLARFVARARLVTPPVRFLLLSSLLVFAWFEIFFVRLPAEAAYLLPALPALVLIIALGRSRLSGRLARDMLTLLLLFEVVHGFVRLDLFQLGFEADQPTTLFPRTTIVTVKRGIRLRSHPGDTASLGLYIEEGVLVEDGSLRRRNQAKWTQWLRDTWPDHPD